MTIETSVLIVGGGPIGLTLALDLAWRGIDVTVAETRSEAEPPPPKCNHVAARSMEIFRRLGVAESLRDGGLPADYANDVSYRTAFTGKELTRIPIPCRQDRYTATDGPDANWPTPEPPHRINQTFLEPILFAHAKASPRITLLNKNAITAIFQDDDGALAEARHVSSNAKQQISCQYIIGCDGGGSMVRKSIGAKFEGDAIIQRVQSTYIRAPDLIKRQETAPAWATFSLNPRRSGNVYAIDGLERWVVHNYLKPDEAGFESVNRDWAIRAILGVGDDFAYDVIAPMDWYGCRLVANKFRDRRIYICGDAAHIWVPYAGYGMNAGIADAMNLSWTLAAYLNGWGGAGILDAYEQERLPITQQVSHFVMDHAHAMAGQRGGVPTNIEDDDVAGEAARQSLGQKAYDLNVQQYCAAGLNFGYFYKNSPIIWGDSEVAPGYSMADFTASSVPGCRTPHFWLANGDSLYDVMGPEFTLLRFDPRVDVASILDAAQQAQLPMHLLDVSAAEADPAYKHALALSRPDQHIAWRGDKAPDDPNALIQRICGAS